MIRDDFKPSAVIFDMDGLLVDSMMYWIKVNHAFFALYNLEYTKEVSKHMTGRSHEENARWLKDKFNLPGSVEEIMKQRADMTDEIYRSQAQMLPGAIKLLQENKAKGVRQALATGSPLRQLEMIAKRLGWNEYFELMVTPEDVDFIGKPDPKIYLYTAERLGLSPDACVVFEDAENGVVAAKRAGMLCVAVPDVRWSLGDFSQADLVASSLEDKKIFDLLKL